jgi:hypothetical protein
LAWWRLINYYGTINPYNIYGSNASQITLWNVQPHLDPTTPYQAAGWIEFHPTDQNLLILTIDPDTLPQTTLPAITAVVNPQSKGPNNGLPSPLVGQSYLLTDATAQASAAWGTVTAQANDIISFNGNSWTVTFSAQNYQGNSQYVLNLFTGKLLEWSGSQWSEYILSSYAPGFWRFML